MGSDWLYSILSLSLSALARNDHIDLPAAATGSRPAARANPGSEFPPFGLARRGRARPDAGIPCTKRSAGLGSGGPERHRPAAVGFHLPCGLGLGEITDDQLR